MNTLFPETSIRRSADWQGSAAFETSPIGKLRWLLDRWRKDGPRALICMANPSYAGADKNDPTIRRIMELLPSDIAGFTVVNWMPYIATNPSDLYAWRETWGGMADYKNIVEVNTSMIRGLSAFAAQRFIAWGNLVPSVPDTHRVLAAMSHDCKYPLYAFGLTLDGSPKHPMARGKHRIANGTTPVIWRKAV